jgi:hypothetical protein
MTGRDEEFLRSIRGGKIIGGDGGAPGPMPRSSIMVILRSTEIGTTVMMDEAGEVQFFQLTLTDHPRQTTYVYRFDQEIKESLIQQFADLPNIGDIVDLTEKADD